MAAFRGLTWDHPRGRNALEATAAGATDAAGRPLIEWEAHSLEGFESAPIEELAARYDVIVLDHPHLGDALAAGVLRPIDELYPAVFVAGLRTGTVGPSAASYTVDGRLWALPLDAATQVAVRLPERLDASPATWGEVLALAERGASDSGAPGPSQGPGQGPGQGSGSSRARVALSLAGPHALLTVMSVCVAFGHEPATKPGSGLLDPDAATAAVELLAAIARHAPAGSADLNPIGLLERMRRERDIAYVPLVYGYVNYAVGEGALRFDDAPAAVGFGRRGSTIGGTGIAFTTRSEPDDALLAHLGGLLSPAAQAGFIPEHDGQPSLRGAWSDRAVNAASGGFYRGTLATIEQSWVRPRVPGYTAFQSEASAILRDAILDGSTSSGLPAAAANAANAASTVAAAAVDAVNARFDALASTTERSHA